METELLHWVGFDYLLNSQKRLFFGYLFLSLLIALVYIRFSRLSFSQVFNLDIWWHPSARLDYAYFILSSLIKIGLILPLVFSVREVAFWMLNSLDYLFGYQVKISLDRYFLMVIYTVSLFVVGDFTRYWLHRLLHSIPWLWEFHKVHHSAAVLTPVTFYRVHPVENILFGFRYALSAGVVTGSFVYFFGAGLQVMDVLGVNAFVFMAHVIGDNLRHSPVPLRYPGWMELMLISPAQHQIHHTVSNSQKNFGGVLSVWDRMFGTMKPCLNSEKYQFGIQGGENFSSLFNLLFLPFKNIFERFFPKLSHEKLN